MNTHLNPIDKETGDRLRAHKIMLSRDGDDFVAFIKHSENARKQQI